MANEYTISAKFDNTQLRQGVRQISDIIRDAGRTANEVQSNMGVSANSLKRDLRQLKGLLSTLTYQWRNLSDVERSSELGRTLQAQIQAVEDKAGELADIQGDVSRVIGDLASDTRLWDAASEGLGILSNVGQTAVSVWGMFGGSVEDCTRALNAFNAVGSAVNTIIAIGNATQKESAIMKGINTVQQWALTRATQAGTVAQGAFNAVANANPYMLLATALVAVGAAIWSYISLTDKGTEATKKAKKAVDNYHKALSEGSKTYNKTLGETMTAYIKLQVEYQSLKTTAEKLDFIHNQQDAFHDLEMGIDSLADAERAFNDKTGDIIEAFRKRALAAAFAAQATKLYQDALDVKAGDYVPLKEALKNHLLSKDDFTHKAGSNYAKVNQSGAIKIAMKRANEVEGQTAYYFQESFAQQAEADKILKKHGLLNKKSRGSSSHGGRGGRNNRNGRNDNPPTGLIEKQEAKIRGLEELKKKATSTEQIAKFNNEIYKARYMLDEMQNTVLTPTIKFKVADLTTSKTKDNPLNIKHYGKTQLYKDTFDFTNEMKDGMDKSLKKVNIEEEYQKMLDDVANGLKLDKVTDKFNYLNEQMMSLGEKGLDPNKLTQASDDYTRFLDEVYGQFGGADFSQQFSQLKTLKDLFKTSGDYAEKAGAAAAYLGDSLKAMGEEGALAKTGAVMAAVGQIILGFAEASELAGKGGPWAWLAWVAAGVGTLATIISTVKGFSSGGIVGEGNTIGDNTLIRVNKNEMVLNTRQQAHLFDILNGGNNNTMNGSGGEVTFKIRGCDLYGSLSNYSKIKAKSGKITGLTTHTIK